MDYSVSFRSSQSYSLGSGTAAANVAHNLQFQSARDLVLGQLSLLAGNAYTLAAAPSGGLTDYGNHGQVTAIACQGASLMVTNQSAPLRAFSPVAQDGENNYIGLALPNAGIVTVTTAGVTGGPTLTGGIFTEPYNAQVSGPVAPPNSVAAQGGLNYCAGMGQIVTAPLGVAQTVALNSTCLRGVTLGWLYLEAFDAAGAVQNFNQEGGLTVSQILVNQTEMLGSQVNATIPFSQFTLGSTDSDARYLGMPCPMNSTITISIIIPGGAPALTIGGMFFCAHS